MPRGIRGGGGGRPELEGMFGHGFLIASGFIGLQDPNCEVIKQYDLSQ